MHCALKLSKQDDLAEAVSIVLLFATRYLLLCPLMIQLISKMSNGSNT